jgi:hypothetical protein
VTKVRKLQSKKSGLPAIVGHVTDPESRNDGHDCQIVTVDTPKVKDPDITTGWVKVSCSCGWFKFYCEYALTKWGAANIRHSNGQPATTTNPDNFPLICKHLYALSKKAMK